MYRLLGFVVLFFLFSCKKVDKTLPFMGIPAGGTDTARIPAFLVTDQLGRKVTQKDFDGKIYIADFFFTSCPTICPLQTANMLTIYKEFKGNDRVRFISFSIDPRHDSVPVLKKFADDLGVDHDQWRLVTGPKDKIYPLAKAYMSIAQEDEDAPGGYTHSGYLLLVDGRRHLRGYSDGTKPTSVQEMVGKIKILLSQ
ncbi:MAG TPA: SCO family protein [Saprospiraceae bacterium]|nr:SCO family protein [Saprospiraceae bacterium]